MPLHFLLISPLRHMTLLFWCRRCWIFSPCFHWLLFHFQRLFSFHFCCYAEASAYAMPLPILMLISMLITFHAIAAYSCYYFFSLFFDAPFADYFARLPLRWLFNALLFRQMSTLSLMLSSLRRCWCRFRFRYAIATFLTFLSILLPLLMILMPFDYYFWHWYFDWCFFTHYWCFTLSMAGYFLLLFCLPFLRWYYAVDADIYFAIFAAAFATLFADIGFLLLFSIRWCRWCMPIAMRWCHDYDIFHGYSDAFAFDAALRRAAAAVFRWCA